MSGAKSGVRICEHLRELQQHLSIYIFQNHMRYITLHNVCVVRWGCAVQRGMFGTPGGYHEYSGGIS